MTARRDGRAHRARALHPLAWWAWAGALGATALRTTNVLLLALIFAVVAFVVAARRSDAPWARSFGAFVRLGVIVIVIRMLFQIAFGVRVEGTTLFTLPSVQLPDWLAGVSLGGPVTLEALVLAFQQGLRLAVLLVCFGAASSLTSPYRLLRCLPAALYEAGVALTVALSFAPQAVMRAGEVREAQRLRGRPTRGLRGWRKLALPVLEGALEHSIALAASMDARGYGRRNDVSPAARRTTNALLVAGLIAVAVGCYGVLDGSTPAGLGLPTLALGSLALAGALFVGGRRTTRSRYRPDLWRLPEWLTVASGLVALGSIVVAARLGVVLEPSVYPLDWPSLPWLPAAGVACAIVPAFATPRPVLSLADPGPLPDMAPAPSHTPVPVLAVEATP